MESADFDPGPWAAKAHNFDSARKGYDKIVRKTIDDAVKSSKGLNDVVPISISTESEAPVVICCDITGSMGEWPATIFEKLPYLDIEGKSYRGETMEISFCAIGDVGNQWPLQVQNFAKGLDLKTRLSELIIEGGGGSNMVESYEYAALYYSNEGNCLMPKAIQKPLFIFIGDEGLYEVTNKSQASEWSRTSIRGNGNVKDIFAKLRETFSVYSIHKPYGAVFSGTSDSINPRDQQMLEQWEDYLGGQDHVSILTAADRVVDVIFGIMAKEANMVDYFKKEIKQRQRPDQVSTVMTALASIHRLPPHKMKELAGPDNPAAGASVTRRRGKDTGKDSISLV